MEASTVKNKSFTQPKPIAELLPGLSGILSKDAMVTLTAKKQPRPTMVQSRTSEKIIKPLTLAEMRADILALKPHSPRRLTQANLPSAKKRGWNSSVKVEKKITHIAEGQLKNNPVRKVLNFQPKPKIVPNARITVLNAETPKFPKPEFRAKKSLHHLQAKNNVRISGICNIPQTPLEINKPTRKTMANKENNPYQASLIKKVLAPPTPKFKKMATPKIDTPLSNSSWKSGSDASFLQKEKEIHDVEEKVKAITEQTLENIAEVSPPVSTPFKEYRSVQEYFNNSSCLENSALYNDNTIMCFDKPSVCNGNDKREESVIVSLCDLFNKATVTNADKSNTEIDNLLEVEKQSENNIKLLENGIRMLTSIKESQIKSLQNVRKLIEEKRNGRKNSESDKDKTLVVESKSTKVDTDKTLSPEKSPILSRPCSVIKSVKSPSYRIPKKTACLRKKVICKSMPNVSSDIVTPVKDFEGRALNMYMKMKQQMNFLSTPMINRSILVPDTPAVTSHNLQKQLDKLYGS
ncbi:uncharacterized protein LOC126367538 [Pectinophora gossypiella]|uniref:uncharacterized protein LOC126367538 n=1 Tax=Pectinophora gossypiella TaxID=13191 RepID=UPI00214E73B1|nr:uncharacterized protein LOC126367538 [Pectinophora gossypiella]